jgi:hypothetical protein
MISLVSVGDLIVRVRVFVSSPCAVVLCGAMRCGGAWQEENPARLRATCQTIIWDLTTIDVIDSPLIRDLCRLVAHSNQHTAKAAASVLISVSEEFEEEMLRACWAQLAAGGDEPVHTDRT